MSDASCLAIGDSRPVRIVHLFPDLMNLYGDGGNVLILQKRLEWRGIAVEVRRVCRDDAIDLSDADLVFMGGGPDREQRAAAQALAAARDELVRFVAEGGTGLFICGAYQMLGQRWFDGQTEVSGLGVFPVQTQAANASQKRLIDNIVVRSHLIDAPIVGYENHAGRTHLEAGAQPFGRVASRCGYGNNDRDRADGCVVNHAIGTYLHGPVLSKNPQLADLLLRWALERHASRTGAAACLLEPIDDAAERAAHAAMLKRLHVRG